MRVLQATRCTLEPQVQAHAAEMFEVLSDPAIYEFENAPPPSAQWLAEHYRRLEARGPEDGSEQWLNWVVRLPGGALAGYVQASVLPSSVAYVAYELGSAHWRQGIGSSAVRAMLEELRTQHGVHTFVAVLKAANFRSEALLRSLGFEPGSPAQQAQHRDGPDELVMLRAAAPAPGEPLPPLPSITLGRYRHYKGGEYEVIGVVRHSESLEPMVLYRPLYHDSGHWVRPLAMFLENVEHEGLVQPRFKRVGSGAQAGARLPREGE